jgi:hypothetical protein
MLELWDVEPVVSAINLLVMVEKREKHHLKMKNRWSDHSDEKIPPMPKHRILDNSVNHMRYSKNGRFCGCTLDKKKKWTKKNTNSD